MIIKKQSIDPIDFKGLKIMDYTMGLKSTSSLAKIIVSPNAKHPLAYSKRSDKYYYVLSGQIEFTLDDKKYFLHKNDLCLIKKMHHFSYSNITTKQTELLLIHTPAFNINDEVFI